MGTFILMVGFANRNEWAHLHFLAGFAIMFDWAHYFLSQMLSMSLNGPILFLMGDAVNDFEWAHISF